MAELADYMSCVIICPECGGQWEEATEELALEKFRAHDCPEKDHRPSVAQIFAWLEGVDE